MVNCFLSNDIHIGHWDWDYIHYHIGIAVQGYEELGTWKRMSHKTTLCKVDYNKWFCIQKHFLEIWPGYRSSLRKWVPVWRTGVWGSVWLVCHGGGVVWGGILWLGCLMSWSNVSSCQCVGELVEFVVMLYSVKPVIKEAGPFRIVTSTKLLKKNIICRR